MPKKKESTETTPVTTSATKEPKKSTTASAAKPSTAKTAAETAAKPAKKPATKASEKPAAAAPAKAEKTAPKAAKPADKPNPVTTVVIVKFDVGHGNTLYLRGDGHSLDWEKGVPMENVGGDEWRWTTNEAREGVLAFKLLINDVTWSTGENMYAPFGETSTFYPSF